MNTIPPPKPVLLYKVSKAIRQHGEIWHIDHVADRGMLFRAEVKRKQIRVFVPRYGNNATAPDERGSVLYTVTSIEKLNEFLDNLSNERGNLGR